MRVSEYLALSSSDREKALALSRVVDIYKDVYSDYSEDFRRPVDRNVASEDEIIQCFEFLSAHIENPRILNTEIKLCDLLSERGGAYLDSSRYRDILKAVEKRLSQI